MTRFAPLIIALALLSGCSPHKNHSAWSACEKHVRKQHGLDLKKTRPEPDQKRTPLEIDVVSRSGSADHVTFTCDVTQKLAGVDSHNPVHWYYWIFGVVEFTEQYRHTVTLKRTNGKWYVVSHELRRK